VFKITYSESVADDLKPFKARERNRILDEIEVQLSHEPNRETRNRKKLIGLVPPWEHVPPVWEVRIGQYRAFYDVDEKAAGVVVRAIRHKAARKTTEEIL
jgi:mRNA-degrading endonuclease RelE of RelBE toxin-antitoxin system